MALFIVVAFCVAFACVWRDRALLGIGLFFLTYFLLIGAAIGGELSNFEAKGITVLTVTGWAFVLWSHWPRRDADRF